MAHRAPLNLAMQHLFLVDPSSLHHGEPIVLLLTLSVVAVVVFTNNLYWQGQAGAANQMHRHVAQKALDSMAAHLWTLEWKECV